MVTTTSIGFFLSFIALTKSQQHSRTTFMPSSNVDRTTGDSVLTFETLGKNEYKIIKLLEIRNSLVNYTIQLIFLTFCSLHQK